MAARSLSGSLGGAGRVLVLLTGVGCSRGAVRSAVAPAGPPPAPVVTVGGLDASSLLVEPAARAGESGAGPAAVVASGEAAERERLGAFVDVPEESCLLAYARASSSIEDLDLAAFADDGTPQAVDDAPDPHPTLLLCPPHPSRVYVAAVVASGEGLVAVGAQLVPVAAAPAVSKTMNAHGMRAASTRAAEAWPGLDDFARRHHEGIGGRWEVFRKVAVAVDARIPASVAFPLEPDGCTDALIVPDDDVGGLDVEALDDRGRVIARGSVGERVRTVTVCSPAAVSGSLAIRPHVGQGLVAVVLAHARGEVAKDLAVRPDVAWAAADGPLDRTRSRRESALRAAGYGGPAGAVTGSLTVGAMRSLPLALGPVGPRACWRVDVVGGAPLALLGASARDDGGRLLSATEGASSATVFACGTSRIRLDLEARARPGPYAVAWRAELWGDPAFGAHPLAAGRMLTRMAAGGAPELAGEARSARAFTARGGEEISWSEVVPAAACLRVVVGSEGEGAGVIGRVVDASSGDELDRSHAAQAVALRACAPNDAPRSVVLSVSVAAGKLDLVAGERLER